jgi:hypothetical protein
MAKQPLEGVQLKGILRDRAAKGGWTLCCGAGLSKGAFPDWGGLAEALVTKAGVAASVAPSLSKRFGDEFGWDAVLQAAQERLGMLDKLFAEELSSLLYENIKSSCSLIEWKQITRCLVSKAPGNLQRDQWEWFLSFFGSHHPNISSLKVADTVAKAAKTGVAPRSIMSFNAEPLLYALVNAYTFRHWKGAPETSPPSPINRLLRATSNSVSGRIDYVFCHGLLPVSGTSGNESAIEKLVFRETEYLTLENSVFSWQASMFINGGRTSVYQPSVANKEAR